MAVCEVEFLVKCRCSKIKPLLKENYMVILRTKTGLTTPSANIAFRPTFTLS